MALLVLAQAALLAHVVARVVRRRVARRRRDAARAARRASSPRGPRSPGASRSPAGAPRPACSRSCASTSSSSGCARSRPRSTAPRAPRSRRPRSAGVDALETLFARYLPQLVLADGRAGRGARSLVAAIDLDRRRGVMLLTLPLVPVFMWLIGRATERRARERWQALRLLAAHFLDVVRGLPTLRAFNRGEAQAARDRARRATSTGARRWARCASRSCRAPCSSWRPRSASRWSPSPSACGSSTAASASRRR